MKQRVWSLILALAMVLSLFPSPVWAEGETTAEVNYVAPKLNGMPEQHDDQSCVLLTNTTFAWDAEWYAVQGEVTIDGTVTVTDEYTVNLILCDDAELTITGGLQLWNESKGVPQLVIYSQSEGTGRMEVTNTPGQPAIFGEGSTGVSYVRLLGGTLVAKASGSAQALDDDVKCWNEKEGTPNDRTLCTITDDGATATIAVCSGSTDYEQSSNDTHRLICKKCGFIPGWNGDVSNGYVPCTFNYGSEQAENENGHYSFCICGNKSSLQEHTFSSETGYCTACGAEDPDYPFPVVAKIGDVEYTSLQKAFDAAGPNDTVVLAGNVTSGALPAIVRNQVTLDLNNHSVDQLMVGQIYNLATGEKLDQPIPGDLTVEYNGTGGTSGRIDELEFVKGALDIQSGQIGYDESGLTGGVAGGLTCNRDSGTVTIRGGRVLGLTVGDGASVTVSGGSQHAGNWINDGTLTITGGTFSNVYFRNNGGAIAISGGTFGSIANKNESDTIPPMSLLEKGYAFFGMDGNVQDGSKDILLYNVTVGKHTHNIVDGKCACGATSPHEHCICGGDIKDGGHSEHKDVSFTAWTETNKLPEAGNYYLTGNVTLTEPATVDDALNLCLNGHTITINVSSNTDYALAATTTGFLTITDCQETQGSITGATDRSAVRVNEKGTFTLYGGKITGNRGGTSGANGGYYGGGVYCDGTFVMHGGEISENTVNSDGTGNFDQARGGGVYLGQTAKFTMYGGKITKNIASTTQRSIDAYGGGLYAISKNPMKILGGEISCNEAVAKGSLANTWGGGLYVGGNTAVTIENAVIRGNKANVGGSNGKGGGIFVFGTLNLGGNTLITENQASSYGGGIGMEDRAAISVSGNVNITGNEFVNGSSWTDNLHWEKDAAAITVTGPLDKGARIGVYYNTLSANETKNIAVTENAAWLTKQNFVSDYASYITKLSSDGLTVLLENHTHQPNETTGVCSCGETFVAKVEPLYSSPTYTTDFAGAMSNAQDGTKITLLTNVDNANQTATITGNGVTVTLNLNGHTINGGRITLGDDVLRYFTSPTLKITGRGSFFTGSGNLTVNPGCSLDLSEWADGTFTRITIYDNAAGSDPFRKMTSLTVGENAGTIGELWLSSWQLSQEDTANAINLSGGSYGTIHIGGPMPDQIALGLLLAPGYAFKYQDGAYVEYNKTLTTDPNHAGTINDVKVVLCTTHVDSDSNKKCDYCNREETSFSVRVTGASGGVTYYDSIFDAFAAAEKADTIALLKDVNIEGAILSTNDTKYWKADGATLDLNGHTLSGSGNTVLHSDMIDITICDSSDAKTGAIMATATGGWALNVASSNPRIEGGTFSSISCAGATPSRTVGQLLKTGYAFADSTTGKIVNAYNTTSLTNVTVISHTKHNTQGENGSCTCGYTCSHENMDPKTGYCTDCDKLLAQASVTKSDKTVTFYQSLSDAVKAAADSSGSTVKLLQDVTFTGEDDRLYIDGGNFTIDWNGFTLSGSTWRDLLVITTNKASVTLADSRTGGGARNSYGSRSGGAVYVNDGATVIIEGGTYSPQVTKPSGFYGTFKISGGVFENPSDSGRSSALYCYTGTLADILATGYTFAYDAKGQELLRNVYSASSSEAYRTVYAVEHAHDFDENGECACGYVCAHTDIDKDGACKVCGLQMAASVTVNGETTYYTKVEAAVAAANGGTVKLLADASGKTITVSKKLTLDLNGKTVGTLSVGEGTGLILSDLLPEGWGFKSNNNWVGEWATSAINVTSAETPFKIRKITTNAENNTVVYGTSVVISTDLSWAPGTDGVGQQWYVVKTDGTVTKIENAGGTSYETGQFLYVGKYTYRVTFTSGGYSKSAEVTITVTPAGLSRAEITPGSGNTLAWDKRLVVQPTGQYADQLETVTCSFAVEYVHGGTPKPLTKGVHYEIVDNSDQGKNAGTYKLKIRGIGNYTGEATMEWTIEPYELGTHTDIQITKTYDGTVYPTGKEAWINALGSFSVDSSNKSNPSISDSTARFLQLKKGTDFTVSDLKFDAAGVGERTFSFKINLKENGNYVFAGGKTEAEISLASTSAIPVEITKANAPTGIPNQTLTVINDLQKTYTVTLPALPTLSAPMEYGQVTYEVKTVDLGTYYMSGAAVDQNGTLTLPIQAVTGAEGSIGTVIVTVKSANFQDFDLTVNVNAKNKLTPVAQKGTLSATAITYGQTLRESELTGTMLDPVTKTKVEGTFSWVTPTAKPSANTSYQDHWQFIPTDGDTYAATTGEVDVRVNPRDISKGTVTMSCLGLTYTGQAQKPTITEVTFYDTAAGFQLRSLIADKDYKVIVEPQTNANSDYKLTIQGTGNYTGEVERTWMISQKVVANPTIEIASGSVYTGEKREPAVTVKDGDTVIPAREYDLCYSNNINAGTAAKVEVTNLVVGNYQLGSGSNDTFARTFTIEKADAPTNIATGSAYVINGLTKTYTVELPALPTLPEGCEYGSITYGQPVQDGSLYEGYAVTASLHLQNKLELNVTETGTIRGSIVTYKVPVTTANYKDFELTVFVNAKDKVWPTGAPTLSKTEITYGEALSEIKLSGSMWDSEKNIAVTGTFVWEEPNKIPDASHGFQAVWIFTPDDRDNYQIVTGSSEVAVNALDLSSAKVTLNATELVYNGQPQQPTVVSVVLGGVTLTAQGDHPDYSWTAVAIQNVGDSILVINGLGNYKGQVKIDWSIIPKTVTNPSINVAPCVYTGFAQQPPVELRDGGTVIPKNEYTVEYSNNTDAGVGNITIKDADGGNYIVSGSTTFTIEKAAAPRLTAHAVSQKYNQVTERTITLPDLTTLGMPEDAKVPGSDAFASGDCTVVGTAVPSWDCNVNTGAITYTLTGAKVGDQITFTMLVRSQNYKDATLTVVLTLTDLDTPVVTANAITVDYTGQPVPASAITGTATFNGQPVAGTWSWKEGQALTNVGDRGEKIVIFTPNDTENYKTVETTVQLTIKRVPAVYHTLPTANTLTYTGQPQALVTPGTASGGTMKYALGDSLNWDEEIPTATEAGTYQVACDIVGDENHETKPGPNLTVIIAPAALTGVSARQDGTLTYTGQPQSASVTTAATAVGGQTVTFTYSAKEDGDYTAEVPAFTDAGTYTVYFKASAPNHTEVTGSFTVTIGQAEATLTAPTAKKLTYSGQAQALVNAGSVQGGTMMYSLTQDGTYTETLPTGTNAGSYTVWYKVEGDSNHTGIAAQSVTVTISPKPVTATVTVLGGSFTYTGTAIEPKITVKDGETAISADEYTVSYDKNTNAGTATVTITDKDGGNYIVSGSATFTIEKAAPAVTAPTANTLTYNGQDQALVSGGSTPDGTVKYSLDGENYTTDIPTGKTAGAYTLWYKVEGDSNHTDVKAEKISVTIAKREITITGCTVADKTYTGETGGTVTAVTFGNLADGDTLALGSDFSAEAVFASADVDSGISVAVTVGLLDSALAGNYELKNGAFPTTGKIVPATAPAAQEGSIEIVNELEHTYTLDLSKLLPTLTAPAQFGTLEYDRPNGSLGEGYTTDIRVDNKTGAFSLKIAYSNSERTGEVGTITIPVITRNYGTFALTVKVTARNKPIPQGAPILSKNTLVYGERLSTITLSGEMKVGEITVPGTFSWDEVTEPLQAGEHTLNWTFTPADGDAYRAAHGTAAVTVSPAPLSGTAEVSTLPNGGTLGDVTLTPDASWPDGDFVWLDKDGNVLPGDTKVTANASYTWEFRPADSRNYLPARGTAVLWHYTPITPVGPAKPDEPQPGGQDDGKPGFSDVGEDDWFAPAVDWAADNNITGGVGSGLFAPNGICTRGQIVTFLWRAAGSPEPAGESGFADVAADAYYAKAVAWAVERGITGGIGNGLFAPDMVCTRAQIVTFLWRAAGMPAPQSGVNPFSDVPADAWYAQAVLWAVEKGITTGVGNGLFGPQVPCTRAQVVTFLYRADSVK